MVNYKGTCVKCHKKINPKYNYCYDCLKKERAKGNYPTVKYDPCEKCLAEDCTCCSVRYFKDILK